MKKLLFAFLIIAFIPGNVFSGTITIKSPNWQTKWIRGSKVKIEWINTGVSGRMKITLWRKGEKIGGEYIGVIADNIIPPPPQVKSRSHVWRVGDYIGGKAEPSQYYWIKIEEKGNPKIAESGKYFEIAKLQFKKFAKTRFWDLELIYIEVNGKIYNLRKGKKKENSTIYVKLGEAVVVRAFFYMNPLPKSKITKADVSKWGSGKLKFSTHFYIQAPMGLKEKRWHSFPKFTYEDVQNWPAGFSFGSPAVESFCKWNPKTYLMKDRLGEKFRVAVWVDYDQNIIETNEFNNNNPNAPFIVFYDKIKLGKKFNLKPIVIKSPKSQTKWMLGSEVKIKWIATDVSRRMKITLWRGEVFVGVIKDNIVPPPPSVKSTELSHVWRVGDYIGGKAEPHPLYTIRIVEKGKSVTESGKYFEITKLKTRKR